MSIKSEQDMAGIRLAGALARRTLDVLERHVAPGVSTAELDEIAGQVFAEHGGRSAPSLVYGFPGNVLISINDEVVHGVPGRRQLRAGDLVKPDVTVERGGYIADAARTVIVGLGSEIALGIVACAEAAFQAAAAVASAGTPVNEIGRAVETEVKRRGFRVIRALTGHGVWRTIHESPSVPNYFDRTQRDVLTAGLVLTIEPSISAGSGRVVQSADGWDDSDSRRQSLRPS